MENTQKDERDLLELLKFELEFLEKGGYRPSPREPRGFHLIFEDSPTCMNYDTKENPAPCSECALMSLMPPESRRKPIPCRHIPLNAAGETLDSLYRRADLAGIEETYGNWLRATIAAVEATRAKATSRKPEPRAGAGDAGGKEAEPLFRNTHPKCANPLCPAVFHWLSGGRFFRFRPKGAVTGAKEGIAASGDAGAIKQVRHYWLCESCGQAYTLRHEDKTGVVVEPLWRELPAGKTAA